MKQMLLLALSLLCSQTWAAGKSCDELKSEIEAKLQAHGVKVYTLEILDREAAGEGRVVGTCGGGTKKILYRRG